MSYVDHDFASDGADFYPESRFRASFDHAPVGMAHVSPEGRFLLVNDQFCAIAGHSRWSLLADGFQSITHPDDLTSDLVHVRQLLDGRADRYSMEKRYIRGDGETVWVNLTVSLIRDEIGAPDFFFAVIEDLSEIKRAQAEALIDPLTGLMNRRGAIDRLDREIQNALLSHVPLSILYIDLDGFKSINDGHGHAVGDDCLLRVAEALGAGARLESAAARIGGDEFIMILLRTDQHQLLRAATRICEAIRRVGDDQVWRVTASIGGTCLNLCSTISASTVLHRADKAMFAAKRAGKDRYHFAGEGISV